MNQITKATYRSPGRRHDRDHFFKYASHSTALRVIEGKGFRWSSPVKFNDPFDSQTGFRKEIDQTVFAQALAASMERIIFSDTIPEGGASDELTNMLLHTRKNRNRVPKEELLEFVREGASESAARLNDEGFAVFNSNILEVLCHSRVLCVSEAHDNVVMWSHYADEHRGVVFKLGCIDEIDNTLLAARRIKYADKFVPFPSAERYAQYLTGEKSLDLESMCWELAFTKHSDWAYEKEWRAIIPLLDQPAGDGYSIFTEKPPVFEAIYLGCRMGDTEADVIIKAARQHLPEMKICRAVKSSTEFALEFREL